ILSYKNEALRKSDVERQETDRKKTGAFTYVYAINPANGERLPIWTADYVLAGYGTGAIMAVPAHDERDWEFAKEFDLPIVRVVQNDASDDEVSPGEGVMINSGPYNGLEASQAREKIVADLEKQGVGKEHINYKIRDWLISRQRYWGAPIPMIHCEKCGVVPVPEDQLPVQLPDLKSFEPSGDGRSPLARVPEFVNTTCPQCEGPAQRETDTMDGFACSSWYFLRFADPRNSENPFDAEKVKKWLPVDDYIGGAEHAVMHLLYARMWTKVMQDEGLIEFGEPFTTLHNQGMILAPDGQKMSKSKGNTIEPDGLIDQGYGADAIRIMELFIGPWNQSAAWSVEGMGGSFRFLQRVWTLVQELDAAYGTDKDHVIGLDTELKRTMHRAIYRVSKDFEEMGFNTAIAALMETLNSLYRLKTTVPMGVHGDTWQWALKTFLQLLAPFAPHITEELWQQLHESDENEPASIHVGAWPAYDKQYLVSDTMTIAVQVNGKVRTELQLPSNTDKEAVIQAALDDAKIREYTAGKEVRKTIYVPGKLVSIVI
ncbi:MAG TPA: leucine--tRNA ligase, partial [Candidatus Saccharimonadales bacterium]